MWSHLTLIKSICEQPLYLPLYVGFVYDVTAGALHGVLGAEFSFICTFSENKLLFLIFAKADMKHVGNTY